MKHVAEFSQDQREIHEANLHNFIDGASRQLHGKCFDCGLYLGHTAACQSGAAELGRSLAGKKRR